ncbi:MAG: type VI secretion system tube protein Hcp [Azoarcus sp.]|nr:type VI secretion system tube protein Hcp [Azoarcus sp.]
MAEIYIRSEGIADECKDSKHKDWIEAPGVIQNLFQ